MPDAEEWRRLLTDAAEAAPVAVAETYLHGYPTFSRPFAVVANDGQEYVLKARRTSRAIERAMFNDQVIGRLGARLRAPVGEVYLVEVPGEFIAVEPELADALAGPAHATRLLQNVSNRLWLENAGVPANRERFAALAVLYGWMFSSDHQVIYENAPPHLVHSVDHGHFFPGGPNWTTASLSGAAAAAPYAAIVTAAQLDDAALQPWMDELATIGAEQIAAAVAAPPSGWGVTMEERMALAEYLEVRRGNLLA